MRQSKAEKLADKRIERAYYKTCSGVQIDVMDIGKVYRAGQAAIASGADDSALESAVKAFVETIRHN